MSEVKQISTLTDLRTRNSGTTIKIKTFYREYEVPFIIYVFISEEVFKLNYVPFDLGELGVRMIFDPDQIDCLVNVDGDFIVIGDDCDLYSINSFGELIYDDGVVDSIVFDGGSDNILQLFLQVIDSGSNSILNSEPIVYDGGENIIN